MSDVYCYGMISPSTVYLLRSAFPRANGYAEVERRLPSVGGEAANAAIVLSKLGLTTQLDGTWLRRDRAQEVMRLLGEFGIDLTRLTVDSEGGPDEIVIADRATRTVLGNYASFHSGPVQWNDPRADDVRSAAMVCVDPYLRDESRRAAQLCVEHRRPYVTLDCPYNDAIARHAASIVISHELRDHAYPGSDLHDLFGRYQQSCQGLVVFTFGSDAIWYGRPGQPRRTHLPYAVDPVDTTGAGDAFRAAIAYGLLRRWQDEQTVDFAAAVSASVCLTVPHTLAAPGLEGVRALQEAHRPRRANATDHAPSSTPSA
jgi:sugar/nucleoside kinase (ribokinase family)